MDELQCWLGTPELGVRHGDNRRHGDRRSHTRDVADRRWRERRKATARSLLFSALALAFPNQVKTAELGFLKPTKVASSPRVSASINSFVPVAPEHAYDDLIKEAAALHRVDPHLIRSIMAAESAFDPSAVSRAGAMGLMQLMPEIAKAYGITHPFDPRENIMAGARLLRELLDLHNGNLPLTLASYNAGAGNVGRYGGVPPFPETRKYVKRVTRMVAAARRQQATKVTKTRRT